MSHFLFSKDEQDIGDFDVGRLDLCAVRGFEIMMVFCLQKHIFTARLLILLTLFLLLFISFLQKVGLLLAIK